MTLYESSNFPMLDYFSTFNWKRVIATCSSLLYAAFLECNQLIIIKHSQDKGQEQCQMAIKSQGIWKRPVNQ